MKIDDFGVPLFLETPKVVISMGRGAGGWLLITTLPKTNSLPLKMMGFQV